MTAARRVDVRRLPAEVPLRDVLASHAAVLRAAGVPSPDHDAEVLASATLRLPRRVLRETLVADVPGEELRRLTALVAQRARRIPLQHLVGEVGFRNLTVATRRGVFIPRPETEALVGLAIARLADRDAPRVVEPCTGTGVVALALAAEVPDVTVTATDRSPDAVALARENLARVADDPGLAPGASVDVRCGDLLDPVPDATRGAVDAIVCNPPYLTEEEFSRTEPEVRSHDPREALVAGSTGHEVVDRLLEVALGWLAPGGWLLVEVDDTRAREAAERARCRGYADVDVATDLTGRDRFVLARAVQDGP